MAINKQTNEEKKITSAGKNAEKLDPCSLVTGMHNGAVTVDTSSKS